MVLIKELGVAFAAPASFGAALREVAEFAEAHAPGATTTDVYGRGAWLQELERDVAAHVFGGQAEANYSPHNTANKALFCPSGVMAQQVALCAHRETQASSTTSKKNKGVVVLHASSHLVLHECDAPRALSGFDVKIAGDATRPLSAADCEAAFAAIDKDQERRVVAVVVELPHRELGGAATSLRDLKAMSDSCRRRGVAFHADGARLWEAAPYYAARDNASLHEIAALFDSIYVSFYKGLGAFSGAALLADADFIDKRCRPWLRRFGGNLSTAAPVAASCHMRFLRHKDDFEHRYAKLLDVVRDVTDVVVTQKKRPLLRFVPPVPESAMVHGYLRCRTADDVRRADEATRRDIGVAVFDRVRGPARFAVLEGNNADDDTTTEVYFEFKLGPHNVDVPTAVFADAWRTFLAHLDHEVSSS